MVYWVITMWIVGTTFLLSGRDFFLGCGFILVAIMMSVKCYHIKTALTSLHWTDAISGRVVSCALLMTLFTSMLAYFYENKYFGYGLSRKDFENEWLYYWDIISFDYPNGIDNLCFLCKSLALVFAGLGIIFAVLDKKITERKRLDGEYTF